MEQPGISFRLLVVRWFAVFAAAVAASACNGPTSPSQSSVVSVTVTCPAQLLVGQSLYCAAVANLTGGGSSILTETDWSSSDATVASAGTLGLIQGRSAGIVTISTTYHGISGSAPITVLHQDVVQATAVAQQGPFTTGATATIWMQGFYGVESAAIGQLSLEITDQNGSVVAATAPLTVARGGDSFVLSSTFTIPTGATQVCRATVLRIGAKTLSAVPSSDALRCISITP